MPVVSAPIAGWTPVTLSLWREDADRCTLLNPSLKVLDVRLEDRGWWIRNADASAAEGVTPYALKDGRRLLLVQTTPEVG